MDKTQARHAAASDLMHEEFTRLFLKCEREVYRYVMSFVPDLNDAQDIVQETAVALWKKRDLYDPAQPFTPWACRFALNETRRFLERNRQRNHLVDAGLLAALATRRQEISQQLQHRQTTLIDCVHALPKRHRLVVEGYYFQQTPVETVARNIGLSRDAVYKALQRIRKQLLECIESSERQT